MKLYHIHAGLISHKLSFLKQIHYKIYVRSNALCSVSGSGSVLLQGPDSDPVSSQSLSRIRLRIKRNHVPSTEWIRIPIIIQAEYESAKQRYFLKFCPIKIIFFLFFSSSSSLLFLTMNI